MPSEVRRVIDVRQQIRSDDRRLRVVFYGVMFVALVFATLAMGPPSAFPLALLLLGVTCVAAFLRPAIGVYLMLFLGLIGDLVTTDWWPVLRNMSSAGSVLYVHDSLIITPLEVVAGVTTAGWLLQALVDPAWRFVRGRMFWPIMVFTAFVCFGVLNGRAGGGDSRVAVFEFRPLFYIPIIYVLVTNLFTARAQYRRLMLLCLSAVAIQSIFALVYFMGLPEAERAVLEDLGEHSATVHMNALLVFVICVWMFRGRGWVRWFSLALAVPTAWAYVLAQRRAAMVALFAGVAIVFVAIYFRRRRAFWFLAPTLVLLMAGLVLATWNASGVIGLPAQAVKTVVMPNEISESDRGSDQYRVTENYNLWFTIRASPITGFGFGQQFLRPVPLPDISFFEFWAYVSHNSILWMWVKTGFFGFVSMLFMIARSVQLGARSMLAVRTPEQAATVVTALSYVVMFTVFAYVDIAWLSGRTTIFLAFAFAVCADFVDAEDDRPRMPADVHLRQLESLAR